MREWIDELSDYMEKREKIASPLIQLSEDVHQAVLETDVLLQASNELQSAYTSLIGKSDHVNS